MVFLLGSLSLSAQEAVTIKQVDFNSLKDNWLEMEIRLGVNANPDPEARDSRFVENVRVKAYLVFTTNRKAEAVADKYDFYTSEVEIVIMEQGDTANVNFYLPGPYVKRDDLQTNPDFYFVELSIDGVVQETQNRGMSSSITNENILGSMRSMAETKASENENILMPIYLVPGTVLSRGMKDIPIFRRSEPLE